MPNQWFCKRGGTLFFYWFILLLGLLVVEIFSPWRLVGCTSMKNKFLKQNSPFTNRWPYHLFSGGLEWGGVGWKVTLVSVFDHLCVLLLNSMTQKHIPKENLIKWGRRVNNVRGTCGIYGKIWLYIMPESKDSWGYFICP